MPLTRPAFCNILLAVRGSEIYAIDGDGEYLFDFKKMNYSATEYKMFMRKTGLFDLISNRIINNLVDSKSFSISFEPIKELRIFNSTFMLSTLP